MAAVGSVLLRNNVLTKNTIMNGNIDVSNYRQDIIDCQDIYIKTILGDALYNKIELDFNPASPTAGLTGLYLELYDKFLEKMIIHGTAEIYLQHGAYAVSNAGIGKMQNETTQAVSKEEVDYLVVNYRKKYQMIESRMLKWITTAGIPEWTNTNCDVKKIKNVGSWIFKNRKVGNGYNGEEYRRY